MWIGKFVGLFLILGAFGYVYGQADFNRQCPYIAPLSNFNQTEFRGNWYELGRYDYSLMSGGECVEMSYTLNNRAIQVKNSLRRKKLNGGLGAREEFVLNGEFLDVSGSFNISHPALAGGAVHHVVATDYKDYAIIRRCEQFNSTHSREFAWILSRTRLPTVQANQTIEGYISNTLSREHWRNTFQDEVPCQNFAYRSVINVFTPLLFAFLIIAKNLF